MLTTFRNVISILIMSILSVTEVLCEMCPDGGTCRSPMRCCGHTCCYEADDLEEARSHYSYGYRLSIWNMWYFWFVVLFVLMSCLGGCGYYKQRQRMLRSRSNSSLGFFSSLQLRNSSRRSRGNMTTVMLDPSISLPYENTGPPNMTPYPDLMLSPPPYSEVVSQPDLYPVNKSNLPLYPGDQIIDTGTQLGQPPLTVCGNISQFHQPPPYTEVAKQSSSDLPFENENPSHLASSANQNAASQEKAANQNAASQEKATNQNAASQGRAANQREETS